MIVELSCEELEMICDALSTEWLDINDKFVLMRDAKRAEREMDQVMELEKRLLAILKDWQASVENQ